MYRATAKTRANADHKRHAILTACRQVVAIGGFEAASISRVARAAGLSSGSIYTYFESRESLLRDMFVAASTHELAVIDTALERATTPTECVNTVIRVFVTRATQSQKLAYSLLHAPVHAGVQTERLKLRTQYAMTLATHLTRTARCGPSPEVTVRFARAVIGSVSENLMDNLQTSSHMPNSTTVKALINDLEQLWAPAVHNSFPSTAHPAAQATR